MAFANPGSIWTSTSSLGSSAEGADSAKNSSVAFIIESVITGSTRDFCSIIGSDWTKGSTWPMGFTWIADVLLFCGFADEDVEIFIDVLNFGFPSVLSFRY